MKMFSSESLKGALVGIPLGAKGNSVKDKILDPLDLRGKTKQTPTAADPLAAGRAARAAASDTAARDFVREEEKRRQALSAGKRPSTILSQAGAETLG